VLHAIVGKSIEDVLKNEKGFTYKNVAAQNKKYDALIIEDENEFKIEIKTDSGVGMRTNNVVLETFKKRYQKQGWFNTTDADFICFCLAYKGNVRRMLIVPTTE
jgi:hypothetical protein